LLNLKVFTNEEDLETCSTISIVINMLFSNLKNQSCLIEKSWSSLLILLT